MARDLSAIIQELLGQQAFTIAALQAKIEAQEDLLQALQAKESAPKADGSPA